MKSLKRNNYFSMIIVILLFGNSVCFSANIDDKLIGAWEASAYIPPDKVSKIFQEPMPPGMTMEITLSGSRNYHVGGKYNGDAEFNFTLRQQGNPGIILRFMAREAGTWEIHGDTLVETIVNARIVPLDELTAKIANQSPEFQGMIAPIPGESVSSKIAHITETMVDLKPMEPPYINLVLRRK